MTWDWAAAAFGVGGVLVGFPVTSAMAELPNRGGEGVSLAVAREHARELTVPHPRPRKVRVRATKKGDPCDELILWGLGLIAGVALYALWA